MFVSVCGKRTSQRSKILDKIFYSSLGYIWLLSHRELRESPRCGGDQIGTLLGYNNNPEQPQKLGENQEIIDSTAPENEKFWSYFSPHKTTISIKLLNFLDNQQNECEKGYLTKSFCNGIYRSEAEFESIQPNKVYSYEPQVNTKNFLTIYTLKYHFQYLLKSEVYYP